MAAASIPWQDLALVLVGLTLLGLAGLVLYRRWRGEEAPDTRVPLVEMPTPSPQGQAPPPASPPASPPPDFFDHQIAERSAPQPTVAAEEERGEPVRAGVVRFHRPPEGTLQLLPGRLQIVSGKEGVDVIRFVKVPGKEPIVTFGRSSGEPHTHVELQSPTVSRRHAAMRFYKGAWYIGNLSKTNPVVLRGKPLAVRAVPVRLEDGDQIEMGEVTFRFHTMQPAERAARVVNPVIERAADVASHPRVERAAEVVNRPVVERTADVVNHPPVERVAEVVNSPVVERAAEVMNFPPDELFAELPERGVDGAARPRSWAIGAARPPAPVRTSASRAHTLTAREVEIAQMVGDRKSNKDIGAVLDISPRTVSTHLTNIFRKLDVASRGELADYVRRHGTGERAGAGAESIHDLVPTASS